MTPKTGGIITVIYFKKYLLSNRIFRLFSFLKTLVIAVIFSSVVFHLSAFSQLSSIDAVAAKAVVQGQLSAFAKDDAELTFSFAAPNIKSVFKTPQNFVDMVIKSYPVVHRPVKVSFMKPVSVGTDLLLPVQMTDTSGKAWIANYTLQQQPDGKWLINGCVLFEDKSQKLNTLFL
jgi:hypothetical protein